MSKQQQQNRPLVDAFPGASNKAAREVADSIWDGVITREKIARVYETLRHQDGTKPSGIQGVAERASSFLTKLMPRGSHSKPSILRPPFHDAVHDAHNTMFGTGGSTGRPFKPFIALRAALGFAAPSLELR